MTPDRPVPLTIRSTDRAANAGPGTADTQPDNTRAGDAKKEKCGVLGVWGHPEAAHLAYRGLWAQQHRGQESAGIAVSDGVRIEGHVGMGLVAEVFGPAELRRLTRFQAGLNGEDDPPPSRVFGSPAAAKPGDNPPTAGGAIGHNRYSTTGASISTNAQPIIECFVAGLEEIPLAVAHNGNLVNALSLRKAFGERGHLFHTTSDTEVIVHLLASPEQRDTPDPLAATLRRCQGAFSLVLLYPDRIEAARDPWGWRPLVLGEVAGPDGSPRPCVASETVALDAIGARTVREVEPGEIVTLSDAGVSSRRYAPAAEPTARCVFEHVYFASPASTVFGQSVLVARERLGEALAREAPVDADLVMPMPDSGRSAANGFARASGIPYREGIVPNRYVGRTFIKPTQEDRSASVRLKLNVVGEVVRDKRIVVVDDSIVRGTTTREKMKKIWAAGAEEIHVRISCPPIRHPCFFGVDFATRDQLIAHQMRDAKGIREFLGVTSLAFLSLGGLLGVMDGPPESYCTACFSGDYRIDIEHPITGEVVPAGQMGMF